MNAPYDEARILYSKHGDNFDEAVQWMLENGAVISLPNTFLMGYFCKSDKVTHPVDHEDADCVFVVLCVGDPHAALEQLVHLVEYAAYERIFRDDKRIRVIEISKLYQLT